AAAFNFADDDAAARAIGEQPATADADAVAANLVAHANADTAVNKPRCAGASAAARAARCAADRAAEPRARDSTVTVRAACSSTTRSARLTDSIAAQPARAGQRERARARAAGHAAQRAAGLAGLQ